MEKINRINELARKSKESCLTEEERIEQETLRKEYIATYRENLRAQLHSLKVINKHGNDITPKKIKEARKDKS
ncbi:MAG: DUF896 domain-containing protein [Vulcanibacillus sp.]